MIIERIDARFMRYTEPQRLRLCSTGLVLVTGPNGSGKSSLLEAVSVGLWNETLRPTSPWRDGEECRVSIEALVGGKRLVVNRERSKTDKTRLEWLHEGIDAVQYDTATKAQAALDEVVGSHEVWRRTHVFSSQGIGHFTQAKDSDRKRLLETLLGLERFDAALEKCRRDLRLAEQGVVAKQRAVDVHEERSRGDRVRREQAEEELARLPPVIDCDALTERVRRFDDAAAASMRESQACRDQLTSIGAKLMISVERVRHAKRQLSLVEQGSCPTCAREWGKDKVASAREQVDVAVAEENERRTAIEAEERRLRSSIEEHGEEYRALSAERQKLMLELSAAKATESTRERLRTLLKSAVATSDETDEELAILQGELAKLKAKQGELEAVSTTLSLTGVRASLLTDALGGIQRVANVWLGRIAGWGMRLELGTSGGARDAISLQVHGAGGGRGYWAASAGEQRRIDVALLLALADVANASRGLSHGTLFFDEVFDALDASGVDAVCDVLDELSRDRPVVVISHNDDIGRKLSKVATMRVHVDDGKLEVEFG